jgi:hypothetical protein
MVSLPRHAPITYYGLGDFHQQSDTTYQQNKHTDTDCTVTHKTTFSCGEIRLMKNK